MGRILVLADDSTHLAELQALVSQSGGDCESEFFSAPADALAAVAERDFSVVFAQLAAGGQAGMDFLQDVWKARPQAVRFLLARSISPELMVNCVVNAHHFLSTPLDAAGIKAALERADCINRLIRNKRVQSLVARMRTLPSRPSLYLEVLRELRSPSASAYLVGELVAKDIAISTKLIQVVNSAFYGLSQKVDDPSSAVLLLGLETTASLVLSIEAFSRFDHVKPLYFSADRVWKHSQSVAHSARKIAELMSNDPDVARHAFTAGLVHDIGKLALALNFEEQYQGAMKLAEKNKLSPCEVEQEVLGATHAETGAYLLSLWGLPLPIVEAVAGHHLPAAEVGSEFSALTAVHLAERLHQEQDQAKSGKTDFEADLEYPPALELTPRLDEFRAIVSGREPDENNGTMIMTRAQLKAVPVPVTVPAEPAPLIEMKEATDPQSQSMQIKRFALFGACAVLALSLCAIGVIVMRSPAPKSAPKPPGEMAKTEPPAEPLSDMMNDTAVTPEPAKVPPAQPAPTQISDLKLQAIMYNGTKSAMVINGRSLHLGDEIVGATIVAVEPDIVVLEKEGTQHTLRLRH